MLVPITGKKNSYTNTTGPAPAESTSSQCTKPVDVAKIGSAGSNSGIHIPSISFAKAIPPQGLTMVKQEDVDAASNSQSFMPEEEVTPGQFKALLADGKWSNDVHYKVCGNLDLSDNTRVKYMPNNVTVEGDLEMTDNHTLRALPKNLIVDNLTLWNCHRLGALSENTTVGGKLSINSCPRMSDLPEGVTAGKAVTLSDCPSLARIPDSLCSSVKGCLYIKDCHLLERIPACSAGDSFTVINCTSLEQLPNNISVEGNIKITNCTALEKVSDKLFAKGNIDLSGCSALRSVPKNIFTGGNLDLSGCTALEEVPEHLSVVEGNLNLSGCTALKRLPTTLYVVKNLDLSSCTDLERMPKKLSVGETLDLSGCKWVKVWPDNLSVKGDLRLKYCNVSGLDNVSVGGSIDFRDTDLVKLPSWARTVNGQLLLDRTPLKELPDELDVRDLLSIVGCANLRGKNFIYTGKIGSIVNDASDIVYAGYSRYYLGKPGNILYPI